MGLSVAGVDGDADRSTFRGSWRLDQAVENLHLRDYSACDEFLSQDRVS
jgi:hypothetical protein